MIACPDCGKVYASVFAVAGHRKSAHGRVAEHGTFSKYCGGCRCPDCTRASNDYQRMRARRNGVPELAEYKAARKAAAQPCGTDARYKAGGCRCDACRAAHAAYERTRRLARKPAKHLSDS